MALYRGSTKLAGIGKGFSPENTGTTGQFLKKTATGYAYDDIPEVTVDSVLSDTSENPVQNKVITNALQNAGGSSDHLEVKAPVGELYQLTDTMFLQNTPTLANSTVEQKVGDTADNTQIHIQRVASGTGSNELKLKVKKVGTPGDLSVQVMSGIQVTVTADVEAYWYGDSNNVLASGTVPASSITTSWQEITVTLDDEVGGTEGELLDIVLSIPSVNASNYIVIACDSTQWSEGFSFVAVNGSTRIRSKLMPYCISDGFAQGLLCKVSDEKITGRYPVLKSITCTGTTPSNTTGGNKMTPNPINVNETVVKCRIRTDAPFSSNGGLHISLRKNNKSYPDYYDAEFSLGENSLSTPWREISKDLSQTLYLRIWNGGSGYNRTLTGIFEYYETDTGEISKNASIKGAPRELKQLGELLSATLFGLTESGGVYDGIYDSGILSSLVRWVNNTPLFTSSNVSSTSAVNVDIPEGTNIINVRANYSGGSGGYATYCIPLKYLIDSGLTLFYAVTVGCYGGYIKYDSSTNKIQIWSNSANNGRIMVYLY